MFFWISWNAFCLTYLVIWTPIEFKNGNYIMGGICSVGIFLFIFSIFEKVLK
jgi:hypothetical protein